MALLLPLLIFFLLTGNSLHGQDTARVDSLTSLLQKSGDDTNRVNILNGLADEYCLADPKKSLDYSQQALKLAENLKWKKGLAVTYSKMGYAYYKLDNFAAKLECELKALKLWEELHDKSGICNAIEAIGNSYFDRCDFSKAIKYYFQSLKLAEEIGNKEKMVSNLCNLANVHNIEENDPKALEYYNKSLTLAKEYKNEKYIATNYSNIGNLLSKQGNNSKALESYFIALNIYYKLGDKRNIAAVLGNIAGSYQLQSDSANKTGKRKLGKEKNNKALEFFFKALKVTEELGNDYLKVNFLGNIGAIYIVEKRFNETENFLQEALELALKVNAVDEIQIAYQRYSEFYYQTNNPAKALEFYKKYIAVKDSIFNESNKKTILELQEKYETEKKESENKALAQKNKIQELLLTRNRYIMFGLAGLLILIVCLGTLLMRHNKVKSQKLLAQFEQKLLRTQMNPHFIFNSLASIESFIYEHQPKEAGVYLSSFSRLIRLILENSTSEYITLEKEIETLNFYLSLEKLRLNDNLEYAIEVDKTINPDQIFLPPMLTQPFIENAIEHGFRGMEKKGSIKVLFSLTDHTLQVQVTDNGIGIAQAQQQKELHSHHKSLAMQITQERLRLLNKSKKQKLEFTVTDLLDSKGENKGTKIVFTIPLA